ncbi:MAG: hypothetical protein L6290_02575 [Thermodesulfovibrionales bacterium]|nr:hypothetical protein [Thermodesulfovibrionales bacterium]
MRCQEARGRVPVQARGREEAEREATDVVEAREVIVSARIVGRRLSISRGFPVIQSYAPNAGQK